MNQITQGACRPSGQCYYHLLLLHFKFLLSYIIIVTDTATTKLFLLCSEPMWPIEARNAAIANHCFTCAINRVGTVSQT